MLNIPRINTTSPSTNELLRTCQLKAGLTRLREVDDFVLSHPKSWMGSIIHDILYEAARSSTPIDVDKLWSEKVTQALVRARSHPLNQRFDQPERWPGYYLLLAGLRKFVSRIDAAGEKDRAKNVHREEELLCFDNKLKGRPDFFDAEQLVDYKTGIITDSDNEGQAKETYIRQLRIYAAIIFETKEYWVKTAALVPVSGSPVSVQIDHAECVTEAHKAVALLDDYNAAVAAGSVVASPSEETCAYCPFQIICPSYWNAVDASWSDNVSTQTIQGTLIRPPFAIRSTSDFSLSVHATSGTMPPATYTVRIGGAQMKSAEPLIEDCEVRISGLKRLSAGNSLTGSVQTVIWRIDQIPQIAT
ncbi:MAG: PD-(D/E)XK nuclease family protein [Candidatus Obscuribacterales bacterium]